MGGRQASEPLSGVGGPAASGQLLASTWIVSAPRHFKRFKTARNAVSEQTCRRCGIVPGAIVLRWCSPTGRTVSKRLYGVDRCPSELCTPSSGSGIPRDSCWPFPPKISGDCFPIFPSRTFPRETKTPSTCEARSGSGLASRARPFMATGPLDLRCQVPPPDSSASLKIDVGNV